MFNFFKNRSSASAATNFNSNVKEIYSGISHNSKYSIIDLLYFTAYCDSEDSELNSNELFVIEQFAEIFEIPHDKWILWCKKNRFNSLTDLFNKNLSHLTYSQKEFLVITVHDLICSDGKPNEKEMAFALTGFKSIGITEKEYIEIIEKSNAICKMYNLK